MRSSFFQAVALLTLSSLLQVVIFPVAGPLPAWRAAISWFAFAPMLWALLPARSWSLLTGVMLGYLCGCLWYLGTCYWIYSTMHLYGHLSQPFSVLVLILFCLYLGTYHAVFTAALLLVRSKGAAAALVTAPFLWVAVELARAHVTSFPWNLLGYSQVGNSILTLLAPRTGVYGLSFVVFAVNAAIAAALIWPRQRTAAYIALSAAVLATGIQNFGAWFTPARHMGSEKAILLQPNLMVGAGESMNATGLAIASAAITERAAAQDEAPTRIVLWPESPSPFQTDEPGFVMTAAALAQAVHAPLLAGTVGVEPPAAAARGARVYNSAALFTPESGYVSRYSKIHLVPFGEYVPYARLFQFASGLTQAVGTFERGTSRAPMTANGHRYGVFLCYESIFGGEIRQFTKSGAEVLVNLSDDGWYGDTSAPFQHLNMARMRAIENRRWILRDTNNGITASIDPNGRVIETMQRHQRGAVEVHFDYLHATTFYTRHGDVFAYLCTAIALLLLAYAAVPPGRSEVN